MMDDLEYPRLGFHSVGNGIAAKTEMRPFLNKNKTLFLIKQGKQGNNEQVGEKPRTGLNELS